MHLKPCLFLLHTNLDAFRYPESLTRILTILDTGMKGWPDIPKVPLSLLHTRLNALRGLEALLVSSSSTIVK